MKYPVLILLFALSASVTAQKAKPKAGPGKSAAAVKASPTPTPVPLSEKEQFDKASAHELAQERVAALEKFIADFPQSQDRPAAADLLASSRILIAEEKLLAGDPAGAMALYKLVIEEAPRPIPDDFFSESIAKVPTMFARAGHRPAAFEMAKLIESKVEESSTQLLELANFYLGMENGAEAMRVGAKAAARDPKSAAVHRTLALAHRINFDLDLSADSYAKALELEPDSIAAKRGLAEMKRALGKSEEAIVLYRDLVARNANDVPSGNGLVLALFDANKKAEAETELAKAITRLPGNFPLLAGAAYWYASRGMGDKAVELSQKAIEREPRYIWSQIALARGLMAQGKPVAAEQTLMKARAFGNFPTLEYELASARIAAGFYREAADDLSKHFVVTPSGVRTNLGGRIARDEKSLADLVAQERRASIFTPVAADTEENPEMLKALLELDRALKAETPNEAEIAAAADAFTKGTDKMRLHRQIYVASLLLQRRIALNKVLELTKAATGNTDAALEVADPGAAVMATELYDARASAFAKNDFLLIPTVPKPTLSAILRGRLEEITGWALYQQNNYPDATVRLRRAVSVMPANSAWWRSSMWRLGAALAADGKDSEALSSYIESYKTDAPDYGKYVIVEALYKKVNGSTDGLEAKIGPERVASISPIVEPQPEPAKPQNVETPVTTTTEPPAASASPITADVPKVEPVKSEPLKSEPIEPPKSEPEKSDPTKSEPVKSEPVKSEPEKSEPTKSEPVKSEPVKSDPERSEPLTSEPEKKTETPVQLPKPDPPAPAVDTDPKETPVKQPEQTPPDPKLTDEKLEKPAVEIASKSVSKTATVKPLFEPIVITVGKSRPVTPAANKSSNADDKKIDGTASTGDGRPRLIDGQEVKVDETPACKVGVSQENVSVINNGGTLGILVSLTGDGDIKTLTGVSSSPKDIEVTLEPEIGGVPDRRFFVVKSISSAVGVYQVTFAAPCGKKNLIVTVR